MSRENEKSQGRKVPTAAADALTGTARPGAPVKDEPTNVAPAAPTQPPGEKDGPKGPEPTRFGDWEKNGRAYDF